MYLDPDIDQLFVHIPLLAAVQRAQWQISSLGGITNQSYRLQSREHDFVLRWPNSTASRYLDRRAELGNVQMVAELGLFPPILAADPDIGWYITMFIPGATALSAADFAKPALFDTVVLMLSKLHGSGLSFPSQQGLFEAIDLYISFAPMPHLETLRRELEPARLALQRHPLPRIPCHIDPSPSNFVLGNDSRLYLIDWEFAAMEEPLWDLAAVAQEQGVDKEMARARIEPLIGSEQWPRFELYKTALYLVAASWCEAELAAGNNAPELMALRNNRLSSLEHSLKDERYQNWLLLA